MEQFFGQVDQTLELLARVLRGAAVRDAAFPDLREAHTLLLQNGGSGFALLSTETDRIANSLNTLREQVYVWMARQGI